MNQEHLDEFFELLNLPYLKWLQDAKNGKRKAPCFDISKQLAGTIFSYQGFDSTANHRDQSDADNLVSRMIAESIEGPTVIVDLGTFDGKRLYKLLTSIPKEKQEQIEIIYGVDLNKRKLDEAAVLFENFYRPFKPVEKRIEFLDFNRFYNSASSHAHCSRRITLALDNVSMNFNGLSYNPDEGINGFLKKSSREGDIIIMQAHNVADEQMYETNVEDFFKNYFKESGLEYLLGGKLFASYMSFAKTVHIEQMNEQVVFNGRTYNFPWGIGDADPATIIIGFSGCIPYERMHDFLAVNYANNLVVPTERDVSYAGSDVILRLNHRKPDEKEFVPLDVL